MSPLIQANCSRLLFHQFSYCLQANCSSTTKIFGSKQIAVPITFNRTILASKALLNYLIFGMASQNIMSGTIQTSGAQRAFDATNSNCDNIDIF